jgi:uncharacterized protein YydD (DUF2326 family)
MLTEIRCDKFQSNANPRPPITFSMGLNTVLGDQVGSNSIGKSTFLMIVDFVFGGNDYIARSVDVQKHIGPHVIQFAFTFRDQTHYFARDTVAHDRVNQCDAEYRVIGDMSIDAFRMFLLDGYGIGLRSTSFRDVVTRYSRVYGRDNLDEKHPLRAVPQEREESAIAALLKLFDMYANVEYLRQALTEAKDRSETYTKSGKFEFVPKITKRDMTRNTKEIANLTEELNQIANEGGQAKREYIHGLEPEEAKRISAAKTELTTLRRQRSRFEAKLEMIRRNLDTSGTKILGDISQLQAFFPSVEIRRIEEVEGFHRKLQVVLKEEFEDELKQTEAMLHEIEESIRGVFTIIEAEGVPGGVSKAVFDQYAKVTERIRELEKANAAYEQGNELKVSVATIARQLADRQAGILRTLQNTINLKMNEINTKIYNGLKKAPILTMNEGGKSYVFETPDDTGTGTSYKGLVVFDLSILALTLLPMLIHDSVVLKQIADDPLERILELYQQCGKQVFIALDKGRSYTRRTQEILAQTTVLTLSDNGNELFGRSWNVVGS